jgi:hypothetical protein
MRGGSADKWIAAATLDRYLQSVSQPQVFGTVLWRQSCGKCA